jgi:ferric-dicitrate binding protein FerR (iron transport regulator)
MTAPRYAHLVSRAIVRHVRSSPPPAPAPEERARAIAAVERAIASRARKRRVVRWTGALAAAAAVFVATFGVSRHLASRSLPVTAAAPGPAQGGRDVQIVAYPVGGGASLVVSGAQAPLSDGRALLAGSRVVTPPNGRATLAFSTGTSAALGEGTDMTVADEGAVQVLRLDTGSIDLHVAKLSGASRFLVQTPDAEVEVRGTQFRVSIVAPESSCGAGTRTRVAVSEGVVVVRHEGIEARVTPGAEWPIGCLRAASLATPAPVNVRGVGVSTLAEQNNLFASAVAAKRAGDAQGALASFDRLVAKYPAGPLAESAYVERMRLQRTIAPARAVTSAREYIAVYPNGFAHGEAEAIASGTP